MKLIPSFVQKRRRRKKFVILPVYKGERKISNASSGFGIVRRDVIGYGHDVGKSEPNIETIVVRKVRN